MAKTNAERQKQYMKIHKNDADYKLKRKTIMKKYKEKRKSAETSTESALRKAKDAERKRLSRAAKKETVLSHNTKISPSAVGKAFKKASKAMPKSPRKKVAVVKKLAEMCGIKVNECSSAIVRNRMCDENVKTVVDFYNNDEISRVDPGRKTACVRSLDSSTKDIVARRHMLFTISEAFNLFREEHPEVNIGRSKFAELRPMHIKPYCDIPHNVCVCRYHENFENLRSIASKYFPTFGTSSAQFIQYIVCDPSDKNCLTYNCEICKSRLTSLFEDCQNDEQCSLTVQHRQWKMVEKRFEYVLVEESLSDVLDELKEQLLINEYSPLEDKDLHNEYSN
ncbi:hypothetical protein C0J52_11708 [Blattella germanica]|nr:hypothetical protein C0J52_11708 [Blattella germanica]